MNLSALHRRLMQDVLEVGNSLPLVITGGPATGEQCELDILREVFSQVPEITPYGPVLALYDVIGTKVRALAGRGYLVISSISTQHRGCVRIPS